MDGALPTIGRVTPEWVDFLIMAGAILLVAIGALVWTFFIRKPGRRRRKSRHRHEHRLLNPTLAQNGGLPPVRPEGKTSRRRMPTSQP